MPAGTTPGNSGTNLSTFNSIYTFMSYISYKYMFFIVLYVTDYVHVTFTSSSPDVHDVHDL